MKLPTRRDSMSVPNGLAWACIICGTAFSFLANYGAADAAAREIQPAGGYFGVVEYGVYLWPTASFTLTTATLKWFAGSSAMTHLLRWGWFGWAAIVGLVAAVGAVAAPAGIQSFDHMTKLAIGAGIEDGSAWMLPVSADGAIVLGSIALLVVGVVRELMRAEAVAAAQSPAEAAVPAPAPMPAPAPARAEEPHPRPAPVPSKSKGSETPRDAARAVLLEHPDWTISQVADAAGCSPGTVKNAKRDLEQLQAKAATNGHLAVAS